MASQGSPAALEDVPLPTEGGGAFRWPTYFRILSEADQDRLLAKGYATFEPGVPITYNFTIKASD